MRQPKIATKKHNSDKLSGSARVIAKDINEGLRLQRSLKSDAYATYIEKHRSELPIFWRIFSYFSEQRAVDSVSQLLEKYLFRPLYLLSASLFCLIGLTSYSFYTKHYGFSFNYWLGILLFLGGFVLALIIHLIIKLIRWVFH